MDSNACLAARDDGTTTVASGDDVAGREEKSNDVADGDQDDIDSDRNDSDEENDESSKGKKEESEEELDEEEELEKYYQSQAAGVLGEEEDSSQSDDSDSENDDHDKLYEEGSEHFSQFGGDAGLKDLNAETQRILRATAERDRLGKGQKIEVRPLSSIVAKLNERRALAIARAPKPVSTAPSFDEVLAATMPTSHEVGEKDGETAQNGSTEKEKSSVANVGNIKTGSKTILDIFDNAKEPEILEVVPEGEDVVVELPDQLENYTDKNENKSKLSESPFGRINLRESEELDDFIDEAPLIDDGIDSNDESDSDSEYSWQAKKEDAIVQQSPTAGKEALLTGREVEVAEAEDGSSIEHNASVSEYNEINDVDAGESEEISERDGARSEVDKLGTHEDSVVIDQPESSRSPHLEAFIASEKTNKTFKRAQKRFLDMEAELSDEEGAGVAVSDDEDEDDLDDNGELADLVTADKALLAKDKLAAEELHRDWELRKDAQEIQKLLRNMENGFGRNRGLNMLDEDDASVNGRRRRARFGEDNLEEGVLWPGSIFGTDLEIDEECEDEAMLRKAQQQRLLAASQTQTQSLGDIPLDEDSQLVLDLLARSASESQGNPFNEGTVSSRKESKCNLKNRTSTLNHAPSFVGRQNSLVKNHGSSSVSMGGGRSFVFGRNENSNQDNGEAAPSGSQSSVSDPVGPTSFANLHHITKNSKEERLRKLKRKAGTTLVSRLSKSCSLDLSQSQNSVDAASAVWQHVVLGSSKHSRK